MAVLHTVRRTLRAGADRPTGRCTALKYWTARPVPISFACPKTRGIWIARADAELDPFDTYAHIE
jgi:hypothetical protein